MIFHTPSLTLRVIILISVWYMRYIRYMRYLVADHLTFLSTSSGICTKCVYMKCSASCGQQGISVGTHNCTISMNGFIIIHILLLLLLLVLSDLGNAGVIIEAVLLIETITPTIYNNNVSEDTFFRYLFSCSLYCIYYELT